MIKFRRFANDQINRVAQIAVDDREVTLAYFMPSGRRISVQRFETLPVHADGLVARIVGKLTHNGYRECQP